MFRFNAQSQSFIHFEQHTQHAPMIAPAESAVNLPVASEFVMHELQEPGTGNYLSLVRQYSS